MNNNLSAFDLLQNDPSGAGLHKIKEVLLELRNQVKSAMDQGLNQDDFALAQKIYAAIEAGENAADKLHDKLAEG